MRGPVSPSLGLLLSLPAFAFAQTTPQNEAGGTAEISIQGYSLGGNSQPLTILSGPAIAFREFLPGVGLLTGNLEGYLDSTRGRLGRNSLEVQGLKWKGRRWTLTAGDFHFDTSPILSPFGNYIYPIAGARGGKVDMTDGPRQFSLFVGEETLQAGPRVTFLTQVPQLVTGASVRQRFGPRLRLGIQYLGFTSGNGQVAINPAFFPPGAEFRHTDSLAADAEYSIAKGLTLWVGGTLSREVFASTAAFPHSVPFSWLGGLKWQKGHLSGTATYGSLSHSALPVLGYYFGDRKGPEIDFRYRVFKGFELFSSGVISSNNLEKNPALLSLTVRSFSAGASFALPGGVAVSGQYSKITLKGELPTDPSQNQDQHTSQAQLSLSKSIRGHNLVLTARELNLLTLAATQIQKSVELQDSFQFSRFQLGAGVRMQQEEDAGQIRNSAFARASGQFRLRNISLYGQFEKGSDLINRSLFATNSAFTAVAGVTVALRRGWVFESEAFRTTLLTALNPLNVLAFQSQGTAITSILGDFNQWSLYVRMKHSVQWGAPISHADLSTNEVVYGAIEGFIGDEGDPLSRLPGIPIKLDGGRTAATDTTGRYRFDEVTEGVHSVALNTAELAADFSPGLRAQASASIQPRRTVRLDLSVTKAGSSIRGIVNGLAVDDKGLVRLESIIIYLTTAGRPDTYTTCDKTGLFGFFNLRSGQYVLSLDRGSLPADYELVSDAEIHVNLDGSDPPQIEFRLNKRVEELPVRKVIRTTVIK